MNGMIQSTLAETLECQNYIEVELGRETYLNVFAPYYDMDPEDFNRLDTDPTVEHPYSMGMSTYG